MPRDADTLRRDARAIWQAGVDAVRADRLVRDAVAVQGNHLVLGDTQVDLTKVGRFEVVGAGKATAAMALGLEEALGRRLCEEKQLSGWVQIPEGTEKPLAFVHQHPARKAGRNEPSVEGVTGSEEILRRARALSADDLCIVLLSGGGSALLPLPISGISLDDLLEVTRFLSAAGAPIEDLNVVRKQLSRIQGGKLATACNAGRIVTLILSDVLGDPLETIASGPTVVDRSTPEEALDVLARYNAIGALRPDVFAALRAQKGRTSTVITARVSNLVIGNNALAVDAAGMEAERRGYSHAMISATKSEGPAEDVGRHLANHAIHMLGNNGGPDCLISGGEPTVKLVPEAERGLGGRNQQLVLAAAELLAAHNVDGICLLSGGTDGEDGPTDAAGAFIDTAILEEANQLGLSIREHLARNDAYHWFEFVNGLIKTGPTDTNVCDVRVVVVDRT